MPVNYIPDGHHTVSPYLVVPGVAKLIDFLKQAFSAEVVERMDGPDGSVMHAELKIGDSIVMMGEASEQWKAMPACIHLYVPDADALYKKALEAGAVSVTEPADQFYGDRSAGVRDASGNLWFMATHKEDVSQQELAKRAEAAMKQKAAK